MVNVKVVAGKQKRTNGRTDRRKGQKLYAPRSIDAGA